MKIHHIFPPLVLSLLWSCSTTDDPPRPNPCPGLPEAAAHSCVQVFPLSSHHQAPAWAQTGTTWGQGTVRFPFLDGTGAQHHQFRTALKIWKNVLQGRLNIVESPRPDQAEIRVSFRCKGHWSYIGRQALVVTDSRKATMNIQLHAQDVFEEWRRVVLHEFGHALGLRHEHAHPQNEIQWNKQAVYDLMARTHGWSREQVDRQFFSPPPDKWVGTRQDKRSIMHYPVHASLTTNGYSVGWNDDLSSLDIAFVQQLYPLQVQRDK